MAGAKALFTSIQIIPHFGNADIGGYDIYWNVEARGFNPTFTVEVADTESGPVWKSLTPAAITDNFLLDASERVMTFDPLRWFRVNVFNGSTLVATSSSVDNRNRLDHRDYLYYRELLRRWRLQLIKYVGEPGYLFRRRVFGKICSQCTDEILKQPASSECQICFGVGIEHGYFPEVEMLAEWLNGPPRQAPTTLESSGPSQVDKKAIFLFPVPDVKFLDIWMDKGTGYRYEVEKVEIPETDTYRGSPVRQKVELSRLPPNHPVYNIPLTHA